MEVSLLFCAFEVVLSVSVSVDGIFATIWMRLNTWRTWPMMRLR